MHAARLLRTMQAPEAVPAVPAGGSVSGGLGRATVNYTAPAASHFAKLRVYRATQSDYSDEALVVEIGGLAGGATGSYTDGDATSANLLSNGGFDSDTVWNKGTWTIGLGVASKTAGTASTINQAAVIGAGKNARIAFDITAFSAGGCRARVSGGGTYDSADKSSVGTHLITLAVVLAGTTFALRSDTLFVGSVDNAVLYEETATSAPQGIFYYRLKAANAAGREGPALALGAATII